VIGKSHEFHLFVADLRFKIPVVKDAIVSFKVDKQLKAKLIALAKAEDRSLSNFIEKVLKEEIGRRESKSARGKS
jgi:hypothetical protein